MRATIIIVTYNSREDVLTCLTSLQPSLSKDDEVMVVDNASQDGTPQAIAAAFPRVKIVANDQNAGFGAGCNAGAQVARGRYLAFLNPDTVVDAAWLDALVAAIERDPTVGLVTPKILLMSAPGRINACGNTVHISGITCCRGLGEPASAYPHREEVDAVSGAAFLISHDLFDLLGGFDAGFFLYMEDTDLSWRARLLGYRCMCVPDATVHHDYALRVGPHKIFYQECNRYRMLLKCLEGRTLVALLPVLLVAELVTWGFVLLHDRRHWYNKLRAYSWIILHGPSMGQSRRAVQQHRCVSDRALISGADCRLNLTQIGNGRLVSVADRVFSALFAIVGQLAIACVR